MTATGLTHGQGSGFGPRYQILGSLGKGGMGAVYRVHDRLLNRQVALKRVELSPALGSAPSAAADSRSAVAPTLADVASLPTEERLVAPGARAPESAAVVVAQQSISRERLMALRLALANEFHTLAALRHPNIVSVLDYGFTPDGQPFFTMELLLHGQGLREVSESGSLPMKVGLLLQTLQALSYLHRRGVLHRDLKPANILCTKTPDGARVKLLDFGLAQLHKRQRLGPQEISGTLGYIAPEVLRGHPGTPQSDLYSLGVVAFEVLTGRAFFHDTGSTELIAEALSPAPAVEDAALSPPLKTVLRQLLSADPAGRFATAEAAAGALAAAAALPPPVESAELRDSVLRSAELVGRDAERAALAAALRQTLRGHGQLLLIAGESGIGKSRLLEELRTLALVEGACVLPVQASSGGNTDIGIFADALRSLCLSSPPAPLTAGVLKGVVADLPLLLQRDIADPPEIDALAARQRLLDAVQSTLLGGQQATLVLLEDLQWAGPDSIEMLRQLGGQLAQRPLLLVGTYRSEERPELPGELPGSQVLALSRLQREDIARLSASILGEGRASERLLDWLTTQSEGNSFFITEAMRAIAEEAGSLDAVGGAPLPHGILTGGMDAVLRRRLSRVPGWAQPLLQRAAIAGRQLDLDVLRGLDANLDDWLRACAGAGVLEVHQPSWRFCHDKLRERLLADMSPQQQRAVHLEIAEATERVHPATAAAAATLAFHYEHGGHLSKAAAYAATAGESAARRGALAEALALLQKARALQDRLGLSAGEKVQAQSLLAETLYGLSQFEAGLAALAQALALLGRPLPEGKQALGWGLLREAGTQILWRLAPGLAARSVRGQGSHGLLAEAWLHILHAEICAYLGRMEGVVYTSLYLANVGAAHRDLEGCFPFQLGMDLIYAVAPLPLSGIQHLDALVAALPQIADAKVQLLIMRSGGAIYHYRGQQTAAREILGRALAMADALADSTTQRMVLSYLVRATAFLGEYEASLQYAKRLLALGRSAADGFWYPFAALGLGHLHLRRGELAEAEACLLACPMHILKDLSYLVPSLLSLYLAMVGRDEEAAQQLAVALRGFEREPINAMAGADVHRTPAEAALLLRERAASRSERQSADALVRRGLGVLRRFALRSRQGWADLCLLLGRAAWLQGDLRRAAFLFARAQRLAASQQMLPTAALAQCWLGRVQAGDAGRRMIEEGVEQLRQFGVFSDVDAVNRWRQSPR